MQVAEFKRILLAFADSPADVVVGHGRVVTQVRDEIIEAKLEHVGDGNDIAVIEDGERHDAVKWIVNRVARLPLLAERIIAAMPKQEFFVTPSGKLRDDIAISKEIDDDKSVDSVVDTLIEKTATKIPGTTSVVYLTSDAGEGKTTIINRISRLQAEKFKSRMSPFLIVPIPLGGKAFLNFDDVVISSLVNRLRFTYYYYEGFLELVRLGVVVPAFDGFEEMFIEGSSGEAVSALGNLVDLLDSSGTIVVAARKAFFEYQSFRTQARLFDAISDKSASFSRLAIERWKKQQFLDYSLLRGQEKGEQIYELVSSRLGNPDHPLLTRAVLVNRLFDVISFDGDAEELLDKLGARPQDYFFTFVDAIVKREANDKWLNKAGDVQEPLLSVQEHHELLANLAREMWQSSTQTLRYDLVDIIVDLFLDGHKKGPVVGRQVRERIRQHSLLGIEAGKSQSLSFDHDDFRKFYLGEALGKLLVSRVKNDLFLFLSVNHVPAETCDQAVHFLSRQKGDRLAILDQLSQLTRAESALSFVKENCGTLSIYLLDEFDLPPGKDFSLESATISANQLSGRKIRKVRFVGCYILPNSLSRCRFEQVVFDDCEFERIEVDDSTSLSNVVFKNCRISSLTILNEDNQVFDPLEIEQHLIGLGAEFEESIAAEASRSSHGAADQRIKSVEKFFRIFLRSTQVDEDVIKLRFGRAASGEFLSEIVPALLKNKIIEDVPHRGSGVQRRYRLRIRMEHLQEALGEAKGNYEEFLDALAR